MDCRRDLRVAIRRIVGEIRRGVPFDFVDRFAARVPSEIIARFPGLPVADGLFRENRSQDRSKPRGSATENTYKTPKNGLPGGLVA